MNKAQIVTLSAFRKALEKVRPARVAPTPAQIRKAYGLPKNGTFPLDADVRELHVLLETAARVLRKLDARITAATPSNSKPLPSLYNQLYAAMPSYACGQTWLMWFKWLIDAEAPASTGSPEAQLNDHFDALLSLQGLWAQLVPVLYPPAPGRHTGRMSVCEHQGMPEPATVFAWDESIWSQDEVAQLMRRAVKDAFKAEPKTFRNDKLLPSFDVVVADLLGKGLRLTPAMPVLTMTELLSGPRRSR